MVVLVLTASGCGKRETDVERRQREVNAVKSEIALLKTSIGSFQLDVGSPPTTAQGLAALRRQPADLPGPAKWGGPYLEKDVPLDPWSHPYNYACPGMHNPDSYDLWSSGPEGGQIEIGNW
jgi:general secretion pathway protein G